MPRSFTIPCRNCNALYQTIESQWPGFCSESCQQAYPQPKPAPVYRRPRTPQPKIPRRKEEQVDRKGYRQSRAGYWERQRRKALERDGYRCMVCGRRDRLEVHHLRPRWTFGDNVRDMHALDNLVTLCPKHHAEAERHSRLVWGSSGES